MRSPGEWIVDPSQPVDRRWFLRSSAVAAGGLWLASAGCAPQTAGFIPPDPEGPFTLGVMSGLHSPSEVVLWTRLEPSKAPGVDSLGWIVATDPSMVDVVDSGIVAVGPSADWTAKVLVGALDADRSYWYQFSADGTASAVGRARTLPARGSAPDRLRLAFASCQLWKQGWYNAWAGIAAEDVDAVLWLGDYIYEAGAASDGVRVDPGPAATDLSSYRAKYRLYRSDSMLQAGHAAHPLVAVWDDHEFVNNYNSATLAARPLRAAAAYRAWFEYMPVWPIDGNRIYRSLQWGGLADVMMLDTRQYRDPQPDTPEGERFNSGASVAEAARPNRTILGAAQRGWLLDELDTAQSKGVVWKLVGNQVKISPTRAIDLDTDLARSLNPATVLHDGVYLGLDSWDGYFAERDVVLGHIADRGIDNVAFLTGDVHSFWQSTLQADYDDPASPMVANEFVSGAISSPTGTLGNENLAYVLESQYRNFSPPYRYVDLRRNGYGILDATPNSLTVSFRVTNAQVRGSATGTSATFTLVPGNPVPSVGLVNP